MGDQTVHHMITARVVEEVFADKSLLDAAGKIDGFNQQDFTNSLNEAQASQDRGWGPSPLPWYFVPSAQKEHALADPRLSPMENVHRIEAAILEHIKAAHECYIRRDTDGEIKHLGEAVHLLEDSYSEAHAFRDDSVHKGDPYAMLKSLNVYDLGGLLIAHIPPAQ